MKYRATAYLFAIGLSFLSISQGYAAIIYDNGGPAANSAGFISDFSSSALTSTQVADSFTLEPGENTITDIHWWGVYILTVPPEEVPADDFTIRFFRDDESDPMLVPVADPFLDLTGDALDVGRESTNIFSRGLEVFEFWTFIPAETLTADMIFWLSIVNNTPDSSDDWGWLPSSDSDVFNALRLEEGVAWGATQFGSLAFNLTNNPVPIPPAFGLFAAGLLALGFIVRRRRRAI